MASRQLRGSLLHPHILSGRNVRLGSVLPALSVRHASTTASASQATANPGSTPVLPWAEYLSIRRGKRRWEIVGTPTAKCLQTARNALFLLLERLLPSLRLLEGSGEVCRISARSNPTPLQLSWVLSQFGCIWPRLWPAPVRLLACCVPLNMPELTSYWLSSGAGYLIGPVSASFHLHCSSLITV